MGNLEGLIYPLARFSLINLFISSVSGRVRGYTLQSVGRKLSLSLIAWSQGQDLGKCFALSLSKTSKYSCNSRGTISGRVHVSSFLAFSFWTSLVEKFMVRAIQVSVRGARVSWVSLFSRVNSHIFSSIISSFMIGYWVRFRGSLGSGSSCIRVCCIRLSSDHLFCISTILLVAAANFWFMVCHGMKILLVFQSIVGLCSFSQGSPKRRSLFPVFVESCQELLIIKDNMGPDTMGNLS